MHLSHILAADGFDDVALVVRGMEAGPTPSLGLNVQRSAACQRVLQRWNKNKKLKYILFYIHYFHRELMNPENCAY